MLGFFAAAAAGAGKALFAFTEYAGTGSALNVKTKQKLSTEGGMVLIKNGTDTVNWTVFDIERGATKYLSTNTTTAETTTAQTLTAFNADGFSVGTDNLVNGSGDAIKAFSWLISEGFFDVVTYTGTGSARTVAHNLGVAPSMMWVKCYSNAGHGWAVYHSSNTASPATDYLYLQSGGGTADDAGFWNDTLPTDVAFTVGIQDDTNFSGKSFVAYLFADKEGVSKSGSYAGDSSTSNAITGLGFEPRVVLVKRATGVNQWYMHYADGGGSTDYLMLNGTNATATPNQLTFDSDGFTLLSANSGWNASGDTYIYFAWA